MIKTNSVKNGWLKVEVCLKKKTNPEHKYSVTFVSKVGTIIKTAISLLCECFALKER